MTTASTVSDVGAPPGKSARRRADIKRDRRNWRQFVGFAPAAVLFGVFFIAPLCLIVVYSFWETKNYELVPAFTTKNYQTIITTGTYVKTFVKTVIMALLATIATLALAFPLCYWLVRYVPKKLQRVLAYQFDFPVMAWAPLAELAEETCVGLLGEVSAEYADRPPADLVEEAKAALDRVAPAVTSSR